MSPNVSRHLTESHVTLPCPSPSLALLFFLSFFFFYLMSLVPLPSGFFPPFQNSYPCTLSRMYFLSTLYIATYFSQSSDFRFCYRAQCSITISVSFIFRSTFIFFCHFSLSFAFGFGFVISFALSFLLCDPFSFLSIP